jgi:integrase/recombinase XerD
MEEYMQKTHRGRPIGISGQAPVLKPNEVGTVLRVARSRSRLPERSEVVLCISLYLGLRAKEIASLKWGDVYEDDGQPRQILRLKSAYTKGAKARDVYLTAPQLRKVLTAYGWKYHPLKTPESSLFRSQKGGNMTPSSMARFLKTLYAEAGLNKASSHTGRRTFITSLAERGIDLKAISVLAGHSNIRTTALYVDANPERLSRILSDVAW